VAFFSDPYFPFENFNFLIHLVDSKLIGVPVTVLKIHPMVRRFNFIATREAAINCSKR